MDLHALVWLENWLTNYFQGIVLVVSHDTVFLDAITTDILEFKSTLVGHSASALTSYNGDYTNYVAVKEEEKIHQARLRAQYEREREKLQEFISREGKKYDNPQHQAQRKMKMKQLEKLIEIDMIEDETELVLKFPRPYSSFDSNERMIGLTDVSFGWPNAAGDTTQFLFENVNMTIRHGSRIAIVGKNGSGKTCLLNLISGEMAPNTGSVTRHVGSRIRILHQHHYQGEQLDPSLSPLEHMRRLPQHESTAVGLHDLGTRQEETAQRAYLANFGIVGSRAMIPVKYLSGGQRMRVALAVAFYTKPDILILDEPTNHLDADTVRALCEALVSFEVRFGLRAIRRRLCPVSGQCADRCWCWVFRERSSRCRTTKRTSTASSTGCPPRLVPPVRKAALRRRSTRWRVRRRGSTPRESSGCSLTTPFANTKAPSRNTRSRC